MKLVLVGPRSVGKSTVSKMLSKKIGYSYLESDDLMNKEMKKYGGLDSAIKSGNIEEIMIRGCFVVENSLKNDNVVLDLAGGAISSKKGYELGVCQKIIEILKKNSFVIGLLPFEDDEKSVDFLYCREKKRIHFKDMNFDELKKKVKKDYLKIPKVLRNISEVIIFVEEKSAQKIVDEIYSKIKDKL